MLKIRLHGSLEEIKKVTDNMLMDKKYKVLAVSKPYKDRGESTYYRSYIDVEVK